MFNFLISFILIIEIIKCNNDNSKYEEKPNYIKFPFNTKIKSKSNSINNIDKTYFNESDFIQSFLNNPIFITLSIGSPPQKIQLMLQQNDICFAFNKIEEFYKLNLQNNNSILNYIQLTPYNQKMSTSSKKMNDLSEIEDGFYLYEYTSKNEELNNNLNSVVFLQFLNQNYENDFSFGKIGLNMNNYKDISCPKFIDSLKKQNILKKYIYVFDFYSRFDGYFYLGPEPHSYNIKNNINKEFQYVKMNTVLSREGYLQWDILFNKIIIKNQTNNYKFNLNIKLSKFDFNLGLIIGTYEYQEIIEENYFNLLINKNICKKTIVEYSLNNNEKTKYIVYSCNQYIHQRMTRNGYASYYDIFPEFEFFHIDLENTIKLYKHDLFEEINGNYYFLIVFEAYKKNNIWKLGQPFLKLHQYIFDYDSKTIGYYDINIYRSINKNKRKDIDNIDIQKEDTNNNTYNNFTNDKQYEDNNNINNSINNKIIKYLIESIFIIIIFIIAFYLGMKIKESRKKRANELKDDDFEYLSHNNNINNKNIISNQNIELNKIGI